MKKKLFQGKYLSVENFVQDWSLPFATTFFPQHFSKVFSLLLSLLLTCTPSENSTYFVQVQIPERSHFY
jgi:hypothetical protein